MVSLSTFFNCRIALFFLESSFNIEIMTNDFIFILYIFFHSLAKKVIAIKARLYCNKRGNFSPKYNSNLCQYGQKWIICIPFLCYIGSNKSSSRLNFFEILCNFDEFWPY